jgi:hypothetical protein
VIDDRSVRDEELGSVEYVDIAIAQHAARFTATLGRARGWRGAGDVATNHPSR